MTQDEIAKLIPANVVEAAAKASYNHWRNLRRCRVPSWEELPDDVRAREINEVTISLAAGLAAWGGMQPHKILSVRDNGEGYDLKKIGIILPIQELTP